MSVIDERQEDPTHVSELSSEKTAHFKQKMAGFWTRFWAYLIDLLVVYSIAGLLVKPIFRVLDIPVANPSFLFFTPYKITMLLILLLYFLLMTKYMQQTVGKIILGIKVVPQNGNELSWATLFFREVLGRFISKTLLFPYLFVVFMPEKEALHDLFAETYVVHENAYEKRNHKKDDYANNFRVEKLQEDPFV